MNEATSALRVMEAKERLLSRFSLFCLLSLLLTVVKGNAIAGDQVCPEQSRRLLGALVVRQELGEAATWSEESDEYRNWYGKVDRGGEYSPNECRPKHHVAIIIPYRNRSEHLSLFLYHMHPLLQRQQLHYRIFVVEQLSPEQFNRAALLNVGFLEARKENEQFDCFVFQDVDLVPEDDRNLYTCLEDKPKHLAVAVNKWKYRISYDKYFGGVNAMTLKQFHKVNGFSNTFYGWGGEDDNLHERVLNKGYSVFRFPAHIARFAMLKHDKVTMNDNLPELMKQSKDHKLNSDGLSTVKYNLVSKIEHSLYTLLTVQLPKPPKVQKKTSWLNQAGSTLWRGMNFAAGGFAKNIANLATDVAANNEEKALREMADVY